jgi:hypothetical protein
MIRNFAAERQQLIEEITALQTQLTAISVSVRQAVTVDNKLALFTDRDRMLEQQHALQVKMIKLDQEEIEHVSRVNDAARFRPATR